MPNIKIGLWLVRFRSIRLLHEIFFSLNIGFAVAYAFFVYLHSTRASVLGQRLVSGVNELFHLDKNGLMGITLVFVISIFGIGVLVFLILLLLRLLHIPTLDRLALGPFACFAALAAVPGLWLYGIRSVRPGIVYVYNYPVLGGLSGLWLVGIEVAAALALLFLVIKYEMPPWSALALLCIHYSFWGWYIWPDIVMRFWLVPQLRLSATVFPCSGLMWLLYTRRNRVSF